MTNERRIVLRDEQAGEDHCFLEARITSQGDLVIEGQDLGPAVESVFGKGYREYEWQRTIRQAHIPLLSSALGARNDEDILAVLGRVSEAEIDRCFADSAIPCQWWSRIGD